jgi:fluoride ion exporter CrcB/FEX
MAFAATLSTKEPRSFSIGPLKVQIYTYAVASADTSGTITCVGLSSVKHVIIDGPCGIATTAPTFATNVVTLAFVDPAATRYGTAIVFGT